MSQREFTIESYLLGHFLLASYAQVSIKLRNRGQDAYKPKEYGDCITVERRISSDGSGSYKLKAKDGNLDIVHFLLFLSFF